MVLDEVIMNEVPELRLSQRSKIKRSIVIDIIMKINNPTTNFIFKLIGLTKNGTNKLRLIA